MKRRFLKFNVIALALVGTLYTSCDDKETTDVDDSDVYNTEYSEVTVTEAKQDVEDAGINLVNEIDAMQNEEAVEVGTSLVGLMSSGNISASSFNVPIRAMQILAKGTKVTPEMYSLLKSTTDEGVALSDSFATLCATYTYNFDTDSFDVTENSDAIQILFPGKDGDASNTAELKVYDFTTKEISSTRSEVEIPAGTEFPTGLKAYLKYEDTDIVTYSLSASYSSEGTPTSVENTLTIGDYSFNESLSHTLNEAASFDFSFKNEDNVLVAFGAEVNGDWSEDNISENITDEDEAVEEILQNGNAYFQIMTIKAVGMADIKAIVDGEQEFSAAYTDSTWTDEVDKEAADNLVSLVSENASFVLVYVEDYSKIAWLEPYTVENTEEYTWNGEVYTESDYDLDFKLVFSDDSKMSLESFVDNELSEFFDAVDEFFSSID